MLFDVQVVAFPSEMLVASHMNNNKKIPLGAAAETRLPGTGDA